MNKPFQKPGVRSEVPLAGVQGAGTAFKTFLKASWQEVSNA